MPRRVPTLVLLIATLAVALVMLPGSAAARGYCHGLRVGNTGNAFVVTHVSCTTGGRVARRFMRHRHTRGWHCAGRRHNTGASRYVFTCRARGHRTLRVYDAEFAD